MDDRNERKLEDILVDAGFLTNERLDEIKSIQTKTGQKIEKLLLSEEPGASQNNAKREKFQVTARRMGVEYVDLETVPVNKNAIAKVSSDVAEKYFVFPFDISNNLLYLAMENPDDIFLIDEIKIFTQMEIKPYLADGKMISKAIDYFYHGGESNFSENEDTNINMDIPPIQEPYQGQVEMPQVFEDIRKPDLINQEEQLQKLEKFKREQQRQMDEFNRNQSRLYSEPVKETNYVQNNIPKFTNPNPIPVKPVEEFKKEVQFNNAKIKEEPNINKSFEEVGEVDAFIKNIIIKAAYINATDVHLDNISDSLRIRYRVNGKLMKKDMFASSNYREIVNKLREMAAIPVDKANIPAKGRIRYDMEDEGQFFITVSILPTAAGETVLLKFGSMRLQYSLENIGLTQIEVNKVDFMLERKAGVILITGPSESGKTTTAHSILKKLSDSDNHIIAIEDKIEELMEEVSQIDVKDNPCDTKYELVKLAISHDPDVLLVDTEVDYSTMRLLFNTALGGKIVIMTMNYNNVYDTITGLTNKGFENYALGAAINGIIAQRIVKRICPSCKGKNIGGRKRGETSLKSSIPMCEKCGNSGYIGKIGVFEVFNMDNEYRNIITKENGLELISEQLKSEKSTFEENCVRLIVEEVTSIDEIIRLGFGNKLYEF